MRADATAGAGDCRCHENLILRIRYREATGSELLTTCGGDLHSALFTEAGQRFLAAYYTRYMEDYRQVFGDDVYAVEDTWDNYAKLAPAITRAYMHGGSRTGNEPCVAFAAPVVATRGRSR